MRKNRRSSGRARETEAGSTIILGDLTDLTKIIRSGSVVTLHGRDVPRSFALADEQTAIHVWRALAREASTAIMEDRQFFCVSFGQADDDSGNNTRH